MQFHVGGMPMGISTPHLGEHIPCKPVYHTWGEQFSYLCLKDKPSHEFSGSHLEDSVTFNVDIAD